CRPIPLQSCREFLNAVEERMRIRLASVEVCSGLAVAGLIGGIELKSQSHAAQAAQAPQPAAPADTAALRAQYEKWRTEFKTWGRWGPVGQGFLGPTKFINPEEGAHA